MFAVFHPKLLAVYILGFMYVLGTEKLVISPNIRAFLAVGFLGAFTTFSTFSLETLNIIKEGETSIALFNTVGSISAGLIAVWLGTVLAGLIWR